MVWKFRVLKLGVLWLGMNPDPRSPFRVLIPKGLRDGGRARGGELGWGAAACFFGVVSGVSRNHRESETILGCDPMLCQREDSSGRFPGGWDRNGIALVQRLLALPDVVRAGVCRPWRLRSRQGVIL